MAKTSEKSVDDRYSRVRAKWSEIVDISVYDDPKIVGAVIAELREILAINPDHEKSISLLAQLLLAIYHDDEARQLINKLIELHPDNEMYTHLAELLKRGRDKNDDDVLAYLSRRWHSGKF